MNARRTTLTILSLLIVFTMIFGSALAEDGKLFRRNVSKTPPMETAKAGVFMMDFYVPAQAATGELAIIDNYLALDGTATYEPREFAKPLVSVYIDGPSTHTAHEEEGAGFFVDGGIIFGAMDAFVGVSLDDGTTWKTTNISRSADLSSFTLRDGTVYPGHVHQFVHQVFGDKIFMAWVSKLCEGGTPLYTLDPAVDTAYYEDLELAYGKDAVYLYDLFGVAGSQKSVDYTEQGFPEVGEVPFSCVWAARGQLLAGDDPSTTVEETVHVAWMKPERLTSGSRDANLPAVDCAPAGCILTWQEDPDGLRPGLGLGPGEGWSGAVAWQQTDVWYSHISAADFTMVFADDTLDTTTEMTLADYELAGNVTMPKAYVPLAMPTRLTDNAMCKASGSDPYCYIDFDNIEAIDPLALPTAPTGDSDFCATQLPWLNPGGTSLNLCVTEDNRLLNGRVAATRVRMNLKPYDSDGDLVNDSAWIVMAAEESKALGDVLDADLDPIDIGKDIWYYSFDPFLTNTMVQQGGMLNQPAVCKDDADEHCGTGVGELYDVQVDARGYEYYLTEIARRFALTTNSVSAAVNSESGLSGMLIYKQGIINQGGPADIMLRPTYIPDTFDATVDNPYAFENIKCDEWAYTDGSNPNYLQGLCLSPAINLTGTTIARCDTGSDNNTCADAFPIADDGSNPTGTPVPKVYEWRQCQSGARSDICIDGNDPDGDLDDQTWENPYDVAKGHRGFLDGDFVMMMYAWSPNWNSNAVGNDHYNLYCRRSFDGGVTWTTTPATLGGVGVDYIEYYYGATIGDAIEYPWSYGAGELEQGRNVSLLAGNKVTILDPRYSPTGGMKLFSTIRIDWLSDNGFSFADLPYADDELRDPSKFFMVYETGDNTTVADGEAIPLDLFYSRATFFGDIWEVMDYTTTTDDLLLDRWPWVENKAHILSGEAAMLANPGGTFMYIVWNQWEEEVYVDEFGHEHELMFNSDMPFRRHMYIDLFDAIYFNTAPVADILSAPSAGLASDQLTFIGTGLDADNPDGDDGIVAYDWYSNIDGFIGSGQILHIAGDQLSIGRHVITLVVTDDEGVTGSTNTILVISGGAFHTSMPLVGR